MRRRLNKRTMETARLGCHSTIEPTKTGFREIQKGEGFGILPGIWGRSTVTKDWNRAGVIRSKKIVRTTTLPGPKLRTAKTTIHIKYDKEGVRRQKTVKKPVKFRD